MALRLALNSLKNDGTTFVGIPAFESEMQSYTWRSVFVPVLLLLLTGSQEALCRAPRGPIQEAIQSGAAADYNKDDCTWRRGNDRDSCPDPDVHVYLHSELGKPKRKLEEFRRSDWLREGYNPTKENVILIHGYAGKFYMQSYTLLLNVKAATPIFSNY